VENYIPLISIIGAILGAYVTVRIGIAELKKDIQHLSKELETEINNKLRMENDHTTHMNEVRDDVKAIFRTLTKIQVELAKSQGRDDVIEAVKDAVVTLAKR
jgi:hypothetical protein